MDSVAHDLVKTKLSWKDKEPITMLVPTLCDCLSSFSSAGDSPRADPENSERGTGKLADYILGDL